MHILSSRLFKVLVVLSGMLMAQSTATAQPEISFPVSECIYGWTAKYHRSGTTVTVRIKLAPEIGVTTSMAVLQARWEAGILAKWSNQLPCSGGATNLTFAVQWVTTNEHQTVTVKPRSGRENMNTWYEETDGNTAAHEFGHMLGMVDEYTDPNCPTRSPVNTGTVMHVVTGSIVQRYIDAVCQGGPPAPADTVGAKKADPSVKRQNQKEKITLDDLNSKPVRYRLVVSGGPPGKRLQYEITINEEKKALTQSYLDETKGPERVERTRELSVDALNQVKAAARTKVLLADEMLGGPFVPGTVVATLTIEAGGKSQRLRYVVDDSKGEGWGEPLVDALDDKELVQSLKNLHRALVSHARIER